MTFQDSLKPREIDILRLMAEELTNREIADQLYIGVETVRWYAKQIYSKLDVSGREQAAEKAQLLGLLDEDEPSHTAQSVAKPKHNLPAQLTSFIGREAQIEAITTLLAETRLLTLIGPGGTGKTRLGIRVAEGLIDNFPDGIYFIDLAPISDFEMVGNAIANTMNIFESGDQPILEAITRAIGQREFLLIMDNYEHVIQAASVVSDLLINAPHIKILVTSREPLRLSGEQVYPVPPMTLPDQQASDLSESVSLFVQRSQAVKPRFQLDESTTHDVIDICQRLDGMPLAIELAAALSRLLTPSAILARMDNRFQSLKSGSRDAPSRQQTLRNAIDWSYNLLNDDERRLFARLAVFRGGRSLEAIEAISSKGITIDVFDGLASLVDKSMIRQIEDEQGEPRFLMLETIQEYAWECLEASGDADALRKRHAEYFADLTVYAQQFLRQTGQDYWFLRLNIEYDNIRAALNWSLLGGDARNGLRIVDALRDFWFYEGYHIEGQRWTEQAMEYLDDVEPLIQIGVLETGSWLASGRQELQQAVLFHTQVLSIAQKLGDEDKLAWTYIILAQQKYDASAGSQQDYEDAIALCEKGLIIFRKLDEKIGLAQGLNIMGNLHHVQEEFQQSWDVYQECLNLCYETGERRREVMSLGNLSKVAVGLGNYEEAKQLASAALQLSQELQFTYMIVLELGASYSISLGASGKAKQAVQLLGASESLLKSMNIRYQPNSIHDVERNIINLRQQLSEVDFQLAWDEGRNMSLDEAVAFALEELSN